jgi:hypothetical protein
MLRPGVQSRCEIQSMVPGFQGVCLGSARKVNGSWSRAASLLRDMQPVTYQHMQHTHLQYWSKRWSEGTLGGGKKKGGDKKRLVSRYCLGKMEEVLTAIASGAAAGSRLPAKLP